MLLTLWRATVALRQCVLVCVCVGVSVSVYVLVRMWVSALFDMGDLMGITVGVLMCLSSCRERYRAAYLVSVLWCSHICVF